MTFKFNKINFFIIVVFICIINPVQGFEMKPMCAPSMKGFIDHQGANCKDANKENISFKYNSNECKDTKNYILKNKNQPVHEVITREAYHAVYKQRIFEKNWEHPLLFGVEWNDDPESLARKLVFTDGYIPHPIKAYEKVVDKFSRMLSEQYPPNSLTVRSHYYDLQFLHAMRSSDTNGNVDASANTVNKIMDWIAHVYEISINPPIHKTYLNNYQSGYFCKFNFKDISCDQTRVVTIFDQDFKWRDNDDNEVQKNTSWLAIGSILHIVQDSYSKSHSKRNEKGEVVCYYSYHKEDANNKEHHCQSDGAFTDNKDSFLSSYHDAVNASIAVLTLYKEKKSWTEAEHVFRKIFQVREEQNLDLQCSA